MFIFVPHTMHTKLDSWNKEALNIFQHVGMMDIGKNANILPVLHFQFGFHFWPEPLP